jgi:hypothetical protein
LTEQKYKYEIGDLVKLKTARTIPVNLHGLFGIVIQRYDSDKWGQTYISTVNDKMPAYKLKLAVTVGKFDNILWNENELEKVDT